MSGRSRVLLAVILHGNSDYVISCSESAAKLRREAADIDVLVLDDGSTDATAAEHLRRNLLERSAAYYRSPRPLSRARAINLGFGRALGAGYDAVVLSDSDVIYPTDLVDRFLTVHQAHPDAASITTWSNPPHGYSIPNQEGASFRADQSFVDHVAHVLRREFDDSVLELPAAGSVCTFVPAPVLRRTGVMDPVYDAGSVETSDWSLRSRDLGYTAVLGLSTFVCKVADSAPTPATGPGPRAIVEFRYPGSQRRVSDFKGSGLLDTAGSRAAGCIIRDAATRLGFTVEVSWLATPSKSAAVRCLVEPDGGADLVTAEYRGFRAPIPIAAGEDVASAVLRFMDGPPAELAILDRGRRADAVADAFAKTGVPVRDAVGYPRRI